MLARIAIVMTGLVSIGPSHASVADTSARAEEHCVLFVIDQRPDGEFVFSNPACFPDTESAAALASGDLESAFSLRSAPFATGPVAFAAMNFTLGIHYDGFYGTGSSVSVVGSSCTGGWWNTSSSWDNRISSSYNGCARLTHWDLPSKSGASQSTYGVGTTDNLSLLNNRSESVSYHSS